ncbi:Methyltransferase fsa4 [Colletotrichum fructicola]|nr:Methyltransferase fsa4 [Colletotrichum fructicola]
MAITPSELPGLISQLSALVNSNRDGAPTPEMELIAEKILYATRPYGNDAMNRIYPYVEIVTIRLFMDWGVFENIPDEGTISYAQLAKRVDADESILRRYAWILVARNILIQTGEELLSHSEVSKKYRPGNLEVRLATFYYDEMFLTAVKMPEYFRHYGRREPTQQNHTPYSYGHGEPDKTLWEICHKEPARLKRVMDAMDTVTHGPMIGKEYGFSWLKERIADPAQKDRILFVDVGAGKGHITKAILQENPFIPHDRVALEDRDEVMKQVAANPDPGLAGVKLQSHDFHKEQPIKKAFIYFICRCLHNYSDEVSGKMLTHLSQAMGSDSRVLVAEMVMDDPPQPLQAMYDFTMLDIGGKERTAKNWAQMAAGAGLKVNKIYVVKTFQNDIFSGAYVKTETHDIASIQALPDIVKVWHNHVVKLDPVKVARSFSDDAASANYSTHHTTGVNRLHENGVFGEGAKVGVVDSGIQYSHPALGGGFGTGFKVAGGYDFVGDGNWPDLGEKEPDEDPLDILGHGTHVAGIVAGSSTNFVGVAPEASLYAYKVFTSTGETDEATLIEAFLKAYDDGMDIITASIGGPNGFSDNAWAEVASRIVDRGVLVTIAAGNSGDSGPFYGSSGSSGKNVLAVASVEGESAPMPAFKATFALRNETSSSRIGYIPSVLYFPESVAGWPILPLGLDTNATAEACEPYPEGSHNLIGAVALVRRGGCDAMTKQANLNVLGARYILIYNNESPLAQLYTDDYQSALAVIERHSGEAIVEAVKAGTSVTADFSAGPNDVVGLPRDFAGLPSSFTSWGGLYDLEIKPDIAAPGGEIFSAYPTDSFSTLSGTSMACPYVAGVAALYIGAHGGRTVHGPGFAKMLARRIIASGKTVKWWDGALDMAAPPPQVGTGLVDAFKVVNATTSLEFEKFALNDTANFVASHEVVVRNEGSGDVAYTFSVEDGAGMEILLPLDTSVSSSPRVRALEEVQPREMPVEVVLPEGFTLKAGESKTVSVTFQAPDFGNPAGLPLYSGKVIVSESNNESLAIPYMGLAADLKKEMDDMYMHGFPKATTTYNFIPIEEKPYWTNEIWQDEDWLWLTIQMKWGSKELRWDIYEAGWNESDWSYPPAVGEDGHIGSVAYYDRSDTEYWSPFSDSSGPFDVIPFPLENVHRNAIYTSYRHTFFWFGVLANGSQIEPGNYTMRFAALKPFGDPAKSEDWSIWKSPQVSILGKFGPSPWG